MIEVKRNISARLPVILVDSANSPVAGVAFGAVTATVEKADGTTQAVTVTVSDWAENTTGAFNGAGKYTILLPASALDTNGTLSYAVKVASALIYVNVIKVVANEEADTYTAVAGVQTTVDSAATQAGLDAVNDNISILDARVQSQEDQINTIFQFTAGRWKIFSTGPDANRIVYYEEDGITVVAKFDLKDLTGSPTYQAAFERVKVP